MALPMDEQRILEEMERMLAADDPRLAAQLSSFGRPGLGRAIQTRRARSLITFAMLATVAVLIYALIAFRIGSTNHGFRPAQTVISTASVAPRAGSAPPPPPPQLTRGPQARLWH